MPFSGGSAGSPQRSGFREKPTNYGSPEGSSTAVFKRHIFILLLLPFYFHPILPFDTYFHSILSFMSMKAYACVIFSTAWGYALSCTCVALPRATHSLDFLVNINWKCSLSSSQSSRQEKRSGTFPNCTSLGRKTGRERVSSEVEGGASTCICNYKCLILDRELKEAQAI